MRVRVDSTKNYNTIVVGGGQSGLAIGYYLNRAGDNFLILDSGQAMGESWRNRYDSLVLFTPSQYDSLPGFEFPARTDTYPIKNEVANYIAAYAERFRLPVQLRTTVTHVAQSGCRFVVATTRGTYTAAQVVIATGTMQCPFVPKYSNALAADVFQIHSSGYRNPQQLVPGNVLVVGAGNSGAQIAAELSSDRQVYLAIGREPRYVPQRFLGRDYLWWVIRLGMMDATPNSWPWGRMIRATNSIVGTELRHKIRCGQVICTARVVGIADDQIYFADGTRQRFANVVWATGYKHDFTWIDAPIFDDDGQPIHRRGVTAVPGLYFLGLRWLHTGGSGFMGFVGRDAKYLDEQMTSRPAALASKKVIFPLSVGS